MSYTPVVHVGTKTIIYNQVTTKTGNFRYYKKTRHLSIQKSNISLVKRITYITQVFLQQSVRSFN